MHYMDRLRDATETLPLAMHWHAKQAQMHDDHLQLEGQRELLVATRVVTVGLTTVHVGPQCSR